MAEGYSTTSIDSKMKDIGNVVGSLTSARFKSKLPDFGTGTGVLQYSQFCWSASVKRFLKISMEFLVISFVMIPCVHDYSLFIGVFRVICHFRNPQNSPKHTK
jgi:hypothetical protein